LSYARKYTKNNSSNRLNLQTPPPRLRLGGGVLKIDSTLSSPRMRGSRKYERYWIPAYAGMTRGMFYIFFLIPILIPYTIYAACSISNFFFGVIP